MSQSHDPVARKLAFAALVLAGFALALAAWAVKIGIDYQNDVKTLGDVIEIQRSSSASPLGRPPMQLAE